MARSILDLDDNVLLLIVEHLDGGQQRLVPFYQRRHLSVESFRNPRHPTRVRGEPQRIPPRVPPLRDVAARRNGCASRRASRRPAAQARQIASSPRIARYVRKFCYMVPFLRRR